SRVSPINTSTSFSDAATEAIHKPRSFTELLENPDLQFHGVQSSAQGHSDLYVICQLVADSKPLTIPFRTSSKAF
ncbi:hypothetical protein BT96DRAFT_776778, partial [Gymnopus androsaceus JB14]